MQEQLAPSAQLLDHTAAFYQLELHRYPEGIHYLANADCTIPFLSRNSALAMRPVEHAPSSQRFGYSLERLLEVGLIRPQGQDAFCRRVIFPCRQQNRIVNLYGRSIGRRIPSSTCYHAPKEDLFAWESVRQFRT